jgi:hypothetical protein
MSLFQCQNLRCQSHVNTITDNRDRDGNLLPPGQFRCSYCGTIQSHDVDPELALEEQKRANTVIKFIECPNGSGKVHEVYVPNDPASPSYADPLEKYLGCKCEMAQPVETRKRVVRFWQENDDGSRSIAQKMIEEEVVPIVPSGHTVLELLQTGKVVQTASFNQAVRR